MITIVDGKKYITVKEAQPVDDACGYCIARNDNALCCSLGDACQENVGVVFKEAPCDPT